MCWVPVTWTCGSNRQRVWPVTGSNGWLLAWRVLVRGFADALMMRLQQALVIGASQGYLPPEHYNQIFSAHG